MKSPYGLILVMAIFAILSMCEVALSKGTTHFVSYGFAGAGIAKIAQYFESSEVSK